MVVATDRAVLVLEGVEAVGTRHDDLALLGGDAVERVVDGLDVLLGEHLEQELVARAASGVAGAGLALAQDRELHTGGVQQRRDRLGGLLGAVRHSLLRRAGAAADGGLSLPRCRAGRGWSPSSLRARPGGSPRRASPWRGPVVAARAVPTGPPTDGGAVLARSRTAPRRPPS